MSQTRLKLRGRSYTCGGIWRNANTNSDGNSDTDHNANAYDHANGDSDSNSNAYTNVYANTHRNADSNVYAYIKAFSYTASTPHAATSPIAEKQIVTDVKWLGAREKSREFPSRSGKRIEYCPQMRRVVLFPIMLHHPRYVLRMVVYTMTVQGWASAKNELERVTEIVALQSLEASGTLWAIWV